MTNNKEQTAVDFAVEKLAAFIKGNDLAISLIKHQAKEMEKGQMKIAFEIYRDLLSHYEDGSAFEDYYKQTYGGNEQ